MAIAWPSTLRFSQQQWGVTYNNFTFTSPLTNAQQPYSMPGAYWACSLTFEVMTQAQERVFTAFMGELQGSYGTFMLPDFTRRRTDAIGTPVVGTANAHATSMTVGGLSANIKAFSVGDYITINGELFEVLRDVTANPSGTATLMLNKRIRANIPAGTAIEYRNPYATMRLTDDSFRVARQGIIWGTTIQCREAF